MANNQQGLTAMVQKSRTLYQAGRPEEAIKLCQQVLRQSPKHPDANHLMGQLLIISGMVSEGVNYLKQSIDISPGNHTFKASFRDALSRLFELAKYVEVEFHADWMARKFPNDGFAFNLLGAGQIEQKKYEQALSSLRIAQKLQPENPYFLSNLGNVLVTMGQNKEALPILEKAAGLEPRLLAVQNNLGNALRALGRIGEAISRYQQALAIQSSPEVLYNLGISLSAQRNFTDAVIVFKEVLQTKPSWLDVYPALADALRQVGRLEEAFECFQKAFQLDPDSPKVWASYGETLADANRLDEAIEAYIKALSYDRDPTHDFRQKVFSNLLFALNYQPDLSAELIYGAYQDYDRQLGIPQRIHWRPHTNAIDPAKKLKIGYVSHVFHNHVCKILLESLLENHDHSQFEIFAYANPPRVDNYTERYRQLVDHWIFTRGWTDDEMAERIRADGIDILIDIAGHTSDNKLSVFAKKPAPVSAHWAEYGYTTGLSAIDYYITDQYSNPPGSEGLFAERPWLLDGPPFAYRPDPSMAAVNDLPAKKNGYVTFATLSRAMRINHRTIRVWSMILKALPGSHLIINSGNFETPESQVEMASRFAVHGITPDRLEIGYTSPPWDVLRRTDIGLDCFPHNSGTTILETLMMGSPVVSLADRPSVGRLGTSILSAIGRSEWVAHSEEEYIQIAVNLARDIPLLAQYRASLRSEMLTSPLMDEVGFTKSLESAYRQMWQIYCSTTVNS